MMKITQIDRSGRGFRAPGIQSAIGSFRIALVVLCVTLSLGARGESAKPPIATIPARPPKAVKSNPDIKLGATCVTAECHASLGKAKFAHGPMNMGQCEPCHIKVNNRHEFKPIGDTKSLCLLCHQTEAAKKVVHKPFALDCSLCHNPHGGDNRYFVKGGTGSQGCLLCHSDVTKGFPFMHGPVAQGECLACHSPHQSDQAKLLTDPQPKLCLSCHTDFSAQMEGAVSIHKPAQLNCAGCHGAHGGKTKYFLPAEGRALCEKCHSELLSNMDKFKYPHQAMSEGKACQACHQPHASKQEKLLIGKNEELCLSCHDKAIQGKSRTIPSIGEQIKNAKFLHGPLRQQNCIACHAAHGSNFPKILDKAFPAAFYTPYEDKAYDLCFNCHDKKMVLEARSSNTGFRNGDLNLHFLHVNREKGRSCRACHHEHASDQPKHIRDAVPFGRWTMHTTYTKTETGGGCTTGCHLPYKYDRQSAVSNKTPGGASGSSEAPSAGRKATKAGKAKAE